LAQKTGGAGLRGKEIDLPLAIASIIPTLRLEDVSAFGSEAGKRLDAIKGRSEGDPLKTLQTFMKEELAERIKVDGNGEAKAWQDAGNVTAHIHTMNDSEGIDHGADLLGLVDNLGASEANGFKNFPKMHALAYTYMAARKRVRER